MTTDWRHHAACLTEDPELFFPIGDGEAFDQQIEDAKAICRNCPVRWECLDEADHNNVEGIWGGYTTNERKAMRRQHAHKQPTTKQARSCDNCGYPYTSDHPGRRYCSRDCARAAHLQQKYVSQKRRRA